MFRSVYFFPRIISAVVYGAVWKWIYDPRMGLVSKIIDLFGGNGSDFAITGNVPRGVFCEQSSQKTRELRREIMLCMISVHREARYCERSEQ